jgi:hypothetical protein
MVIYADEARDVSDPKEPNVQTVLLIGMQATMLRSDKSTPQIIGMAHKAWVTFRQNANPKIDETEISIAVEDAAAYDPFKFTSLRKDFEDRNPQGRPIVIASQLKDKPKFLNLFQLKGLNTEPWNYGPLREQLRKFNSLMRQQIVTDELRKYFAANRRFTFAEGDFDKMEITAPKESLDKDRTIVLEGTDKEPVRVMVYDQNNKLYRKYEAPKADIALDSDESSPIRATLNLRGSATTVKMQQLVGDSWAEISLPGYGIGGAANGEFVEQRNNLKLPDEIKEPPGVGKNEQAEFQQRFAEAARIVADAKKGAGERNDKLLRAAQGSLDVVKELDHTISSELHSRGSFAVSCLTLVMFGAALGVMLKGRNPLAVFVMGFMPSVLLVLLITMGRRVMESANGNQPLGLSLLWAGNVVLVLLVAGAYRKLIRS